MWQIKKNVKWVNRGNDVKLYNPFNANWYYLDNIYQDIWMTLAVKKNPLNLSKALSFKYGKDEDQIKEEINKVLKEMVSEQIINNISVEEFFEDIVSKKG
ncbi:hypothetical protein ACQKP0_14920 [Heyndrickxia sp. NPDC080065]|uniref:hypothetical protein n=1 Tax=Heyndrickxia sp. NPDC080065 TaxID=3390568 RepID=UPI003CFF4714